MSLVSKILRRGEGGGRVFMTFWCPGCDAPHQVVVEGPGAWGWNGDVHRPTFTPSVLVWWDEPANLADPEALKRDIEAARALREAGATGDAAKVPMSAKRCHSFVADGVIDFLSDCTHALRGKHPIPDWPHPDWGGSVPATST